MWSFGSLASAVSVAGQPCRLSPLLGHFPAIGDYVDSIAILETCAVAMSPGLRALSPGGVNASQSPLSGKSSLVAWDLVENASEGRGSKKALCTVSAGAWMHKVAAVLRTTEQMLVACWWLVQVHCFSFELASVDTHDGATSHDIRGWELYHSESPNGPWIKAFKGAAAPGVGEQEFGGWSPSASPYWRLVVLQTYSGQVVSASGLVHSSGGVDGKLEDDSRALRAARATAWDQVEPWRAGLACSLPGLAKEVEKAWKQAVAWRKQQEKERERVSENGVVTTKRIDLRSADDRCFVGRSPKCEIVIQKKGVSQVHCSLRLDTDRQRQRGVIVTDTSTNGTGIQAVDGRCMRLRKGEEAPAVDGAVLIIPLKTQVQHCETQARLKLVIGQLPSRKQRSGKGAKKRRKQKARTKKKEERTRQAEEARATEREQSAEQPHSSSSSSSWSSKPSHSTEELLRQKDVRIGELEEQVAKEKLKAVEQKALRKRACGEKKRTPQGPAGRVPLSIDELCLLQESTIEMLRKEKEEGLAGAYADAIKRSKPSRQPAARPQQQHIWRDRRR
ncbi:agaA33 [Symbiodinium sp. CCMP2592]|nr:agaA33 [Symbiodinium sp. CCMP2592]